MKIDRVIADEPKASYANRVERSLNNIGLPFAHLKNDIRVGSSKHSISDAAFNSYFELMPDYQNIKKVVYANMKYKSNFIYVQKILKTLMISQL